MLPHPEKTIPAFDTMPDHARVWIYQASRCFTQEEENNLNEILQNFVSKWNAHGKELASSYTIKYGLFIILAVDEKKAMASGCSIDSSMKVIKSIEQKLGLTLTDRLRIAFRDAENQIAQLPMAQFKTLISLNQVDENTTVFNNLVTTVGEMKTNWEIPAGRSWHKQLYS
jgi:hypothetical protein